MPVLLATGLASCVAGCATAPVSIPRVADVPTADRAAEDAHRAIIAVNRGHDTISFYSRRANGDDAPIATIGGSKTELVDPLFTRDRQRRTALCHELSSCTGSARRFHLNPPGRR
jgi:hypothetical protein